MKKFSFTETMLILIFFLMVALCLLLTGMYINLMQTIY